MNSKLIKTIILKYMPKFNNNPLNIKQTKSFNGAIYNVNYIPANITINNIRKLNEYQPKIIK